MSLQDIQLKIIMDVRGLNQVSKVNQSLRGLHTAADKTFKAQDMAAESSKRFTGILGPMLQRLDKIEQKYDSLYRASYRLKQAGSDLQQVGMAGIGMLQKAVDAWGDFEFTLNRAAGAMTVPNKLLPALSNAILDVAKSVRLYKPEEVAKATYYWASTTGQQVKSMKDLKVVMGGITPILKAAALTQTDMEAAIKGVYSILVQYNKPLTKTRDVTEKLMLITQRTALEFPDLINSFKMIGPVARANGVTFEQVAKAIGMIGDAGIRGSMSGRALRQFFIQLVKPSAKATSALNKAFKATFHLSGAYKKMVFPKGKFIGLAKYVGLLADVTKKMNQHQRNSFLATITTANELPVLTALLQREMDVRKGLIKANDDEKYSLQGAHKAFEDSFGRLANSWKGIMGLLQNSFMPIVLQVGKAVADMAAPIVEKITNVLTAIKKWMDENPKMVDFIVKVLAIGSAIAAVVGTALVFIGTLMGIVAGLGFVIEALAAIAAPVVAVGVLIAGLATAIINNWHGIRDVLMGLGEAIAKFIGRLLGSGSTDATKRVGSIVDTLKKLGEIVLDAVIAGMKAVTDWLNGLSDGDIKLIKDLLLGLLGLVALNKGLGIFAGILRGVGGALSTVGFALNTMKTVGSVIGALPGGIGALVSAVRGLAIAFGILNVALGPIGWVILAIGAAIAAFVIAYETNFGGFRDFVDGIVAWFMTNVVPAIQGFVKAVGDFVTGVVNAVVNFWNTAVATVQGIVDFFANLPANIQKFLGEVVKNITDFVGNIISAIAAFLADLSQNWSYYLGYILGRIIGFIVLVISKVIEFGVNFITAVVDFLSKLPGRVADWLRSTATTIINWFLTTTVSVAGKTANLVNTIIDWISKLPGRVADWFGSVLSTILGWFSTNIPKIAAKAGDLVTSIINFLKELPGKALSAVAKLPTYLRDFLSQVPGRLASAVIGIGKSIVEGVWKGIQAMWTWLTSHVTGFFQGIIDGVKDSLGIHSPSTVFAEMGVNLIKGLAVGISKTSDAHKALRSTTDSLISMAAAGSAGLGMALNSELSMAPANFNMTRDNTNVIRVEVDVTSSDGSVSELDQQQLAKLLNGSDLIRAIEHMASVE